MRTQGRLRRSGPGAGSPSFGWIGGRGSSHWIWKSHLLLQPTPPDSRKKRWVGINPGRVNDYIAFFLRENAFIKMSPSVETFDREVKLGISRIDFLINGRGRLEIKTTLEGLPCEGHTDYEGRSNTPAILIALSSTLRIRAMRLGGGCRSLFLLCSCMARCLLKIPGVRPR